jgi:hypothetical protein
MDIKTLMSRRNEFIAVQVNEDAHAGRRCEICAALICDSSGVSDASQADSRCPRHREETDSEEMDLARPLLAMRAKFRKYLLHGVHKDTALLHELHSGAVQRIVDALIFRRQCLHSLGYLARSCYDLFVSKYLILNSSGYQGR